MLVHPASPSSRSCPAATPAHPQLPNPLQRIDHMLALPSQLAFIAEVLQLASTALVVDCARRGHAVRAGPYDVKQFGVAILLLRLEHLDPRFLAGQGSSNEQGVPVGTAYAFTVMVHADDLYVELIILRYREARNSSRFLFSPAALIN
ncbi:hypothetical protein D3C81_1274220 [compost metagenome]